VTTLPRDPRRAVPEIRPYHIQVPEPDLADLRERLGRTRWPDELPRVGWGYGVPQSYLRELAEYWRHSYERECSENPWPDPWARASRRSREALLVSLDSILRYRVMLGACGQARSQRGPG
jgi:hypothetical protein